MNLRRLSRVFYGAIFVSALFALVLFSGGPTGVLAAMPL